MSHSAAKFDSPFKLTGSEYPARAVVVSVPHAGQNYTNAMREQLRFAPEDLRALEDYRVDLLSEDAAARGFSTLIAHTPRLWIDLNRDPTDFDPMRVDGVPARTPSRPSAKGRGGLGLIPDRLSTHGAIWRRRIHWVELVQRVDEIHTPWHARLATLLQDARHIFGQAVLIDLHSMPPLSGRHAPPADIVIGDRFGSSASDLFASLAVTHFENAGLRVQRNLPYAGGYTLDRHGKPRKGQHAIQVEVCRSLYLDAGGEPDRRTRHIAKLIATLAERMALETENPLSLAAE